MRTLCFLLASICVIAIPRAEAQRQRCSIITEIAPSVPWRTVHSDILEWRFVACQMSADHGVPQIEFIYGWRSLSPRPIEFSYVLSKQPIQSCYSREPGTEMAGENLRAHQSKEGELTGNFWMTTESGYANVLYRCITSMAYTDTEDDSRWIVMPPDVRQRIDRERAQRANANTASRPATTSSGPAVPAPSSPTARARQDEEARRREQAEAERRQLQQAEDERRRQEAAAAAQRAAEDARKSGREVRDQFQHMASSEVGAGAFKGDFLIGAGASFPAVKGNVIDERASGLLMTADLNGVIAIGRRGRRNRLLELGATGTWGFSADLGFLSSESTTITTPDDNPSINVVVGSGTARVWQGVLGIGAFGQYRGYTLSQNGTDASDHMISAGPSIAIGSLQSRETGIELYGNVGLIGARSYGAGLLFRVNYVAFRFDWQKQTNQSPAATFSNATLMTIAAYFRVPF
jgi:hypothetical protein